MKRSRFSDERIIGVLKEHQVGLSAVALCRKYGVSGATCYRWRSRRRHGSGRGQTAGSS
ncbi:MAG: transposase [Hydrogenophaga sp.]|nr:transposase [Hydrogenophaga sp.]